MMIDVPETVIQVPRTASPSPDGLLPSITMVAPNQSWRRTCSTQTDFRPIEDAVQQALVQLHISSRQGIEDARVRDLAFLSTTEREMRQRALRVELALQVVRDDAFRSRDHLLGLEAAHIDHLQHWESHERRIAMLKQQRREALEATVAICEQDVQSEDMLY